MLIAQEPIARLSSHCPRAQMCEKRGEIAWGNAKIVQIIHDRTICESKFEIEAADRKPNLERRSPARI